MRCHIWGCGWWMENVCGFPKWPRAGVPAMRIVMGMGMGIDMRAIALSRGTRTQYSDTILSLPSRRVADPVPHPDRFPFHCIVTAAGRTGGWTGRRVRSIGTSQFSSPFCGSFLISHFCSLMFALTYLTRTWNQRLLLVLWLGQKSDGSFQTGWPPGQTCRLSGRLTNGPERVITRKGSSFVSAS